MKPFTISMLFICSASLAACGGGAGSDANHETQILAVSHSVPSDSPASIENDTEADADTAAYRGFPEDRAGYKPAD